MRSKLKLISFQLFLLVVLLGMVEFIVRAMGYAPGDMRPNWLNLKPVDSLYLVNDYSVNAEGILVADSAYWAIFLIWRFYQRHGIRQSFSRNYQIRKALLCLESVRTVRR